jgi:hypothetical protein
VLKASKFFKLIPEDNKGTSLLEVLAALVIVVLILQLFHIILFSADQTRLSGHITSASYYAVSLIESVRAEGNDSGCYQIGVGDSFNGISAPAGMQTCLSITPLEESPLLFFIEVEVSWMDKGVPRQLEIASIFRREPM